jgi:activator of HSP90 ATPase
MDEKIHSSLTGSEVKMSTKVNGKFTVFNGYCHGYNIELIKNRKIVQAWYFAEEGWPDDHYSICTFLLEPEGSNTKLTFTQTGIPEKNAEELSEGWKQYYWEPIKNLLKGK